jgi:pimeloyl-ACP methyl ester carboxylesterase
MTALESTTAKYTAAVRQVYRAFFSPPRYEVKPSDREILEWGQNYRLPIKGGDLAVTTWGSQGPAALLVHGWGGSRAQMTDLVDPLLFAGYRVVAYDQPAHGDSDGGSTNLLEIAPTMDLLAAQEGPFAVILAHSFGTLITSYALVKRNLTPPARLVYFGAFNRLMDSLPRFQILAGLPDAIMGGLRDLIYDTFGRDLLDSIVNELLARRINLPALMFHDTTDNVTPITDSRAIAREWTSAQLIETTGLGHRGALQSREVHEQVVKFLKG